MDAFVDAVEQAERKEGTVKIKASNFSVENVELNFSLKSILKPIEVRGGISLFPYVKKYMIGKY
jgi:hypothetical protein